MRRSFAKKSVFISLISTSVCSPSTLWMSKWYRWVFHSPSNVSLSQLGTYGGLGPGPDRSCSKSWMTSALAGCNFKKSSSFLTSKNSSTYFRIIPYRMRRHFADFLKKDANTTYQLFCLFRCARPVDRRFVDARNCWRSSGCTARLGCRQPTGHHVEHLPDCISKLVHALKLEKAQRQRHISHCG